MPGPTLADIARRLAVVETALDIHPDTDTPLALAAINDRLNRVETVLARLTATVDRIEGEQAALRGDVTASPWLSSLPKISVLGTTRRPGKISVKGRSGKVSRSRRIW
jgi:hypothetical protein